MRTESNMFIMLSAALNARVCLAVSVFIVHKLERIVQNVIQTVLFLFVIIVKLWCGLPWCRRIRNAIKTL